MINTRFTSYQLPATRLTNIANKFGTDQTPQNADDPAKQAQSPAPASTSGPPPVKVTQLPRGGVNDGVNKSDKRYVPLEDQMKGGTKGKTPKRGSSSGA